MDGQKAKLRKLQIPSTKLQRNTKRQIPNCARRSRTHPGTRIGWSLLLVVSLELGAWSLVLFHASGKNPIESGSVPRLVIGRIEGVYRWPEERTRGLAQRGYSRETRTLTHRGEKYENKS